MTSVRKENVDHLKKVHSFDIKNDGSVLISDPAGTTLENTVEINAILDKLFNLNREPNKCPDNDILEPLILN